MTTRADTNNNWRQKGTNVSTNNTGNNRPNDAKINEQNSQNKRGGPFKTNNNKQRGQRRGAPLKVPKPQVEKTAVPALNEDNWPSLSDESTIQKPASAWGGSSLIAKIKDETNTETVADNETGTKEWLVLN